MKTLTIRQPWASLVVTPSLENPLKAIKDIENRTWKTSYRGPLLIHAALSKVKFNNWYDSQLNNEQLLSLPEGWSNCDFEYGAIIGKVELVDCVVNHDSIWAENMKTHEDPDGSGLKFLDKGQKYIYNWVLANPVLFDEPIPMKGKLSLWDYPNILAEPEEENGKLFCHCQIPVEEKNQVSRFLGEEYRCNYCGGIWYK